MPSVRHNASTTSNERKRLRDRRAQQNLREKRENRMKALEQQVAYCESHHDHETVHSLLRENEILLAQQEQLLWLLNGWGEGNNNTVGVPQASFPTPTTCEPLPTSTIAPDITGDQMVLVDTRPVTIANMAVPDINNVPQIWPSSTTNMTLPIATTCPHLSGFQSPIPTITDLPETMTLLTSTKTLPTTGSTTWNLVPLNANRYPFAPSLPQPTFGWFAHLDAVVTCPPVPSPLALLYGSRRNYLADQVHRLVRVLHLQDRECVAIGWLVYVFCKWMFDPNPVTFSQLPHIIRPVATEIERGQHMGVPFLLWPQLKVKLAQNWSKYNFAEIMECMARSSKVRWSPSKDYLERDCHDNIQVMREFYETFTNPYGWGLTSKFITKYPELMEGLDVEAVRWDCPSP
ncbi:hypothetical protein BBP40_008722 [Aspergillus hancockii]|nr:hypothetical protein BBP40_008722 [Aspergillus hancockii]